VIFNIIENTENGNRLQAKPAYILFNSRANLSNYPNQQLMATRDYHLQYPTHTIPDNK